MADEGILATTAQVLLSIGQGASAAQILEANTNYWILYAEAEMETAFGQQLGLVANIATVTAAQKQYLAIIAANRAAWWAINQDQGNWDLATTQSKLNVLNASWKGFLSDLKEENSEIKDDLNL